MSTFASVSTTCDPSRCLLGPSTPSVQLDACASSPIYLSIGFSGIDHKTLSNMQAAILQETNETNPLAMNELHSISHPA